MGINIEQKMKDKLFYFDEFATWEEGEAACDKYGLGYQSDTIFEQVKAATQIVRNNEGVYEQDGIVYNKLLINYELMSSFMYICAKDGYLNVIDFGGSLGSTFFRYRNVFSKLNVKWTVIEQKHFVDYGKEEVPEVQFKYYLEECEDDSNVVLLSGVLSYLENPYEILDRIVSKKIKYIIVDEQAFSKEDVDIIRLQNVPESIYKAVYPARLFSLTKFSDFFKKNGYGVWDWDYRFGNIPVLKDGNYENTIEKGFFIYLK